MIEAVIFDVDGTLVDTVDFHALAWQRSFAAFGYEFGFSEVRAQIGKGGDQLIPSLLPDAEAARNGAKIDAYRKDLFAQEYMPRVRGFAHVRDLFTALAGQGRRLALASSAKGDELDHYVRAAGIEGLFECAVSSDDAEKSKPHPDIFRSALIRLGLAPDRAVVVGDTPYDAQAAHGAGIPCVGMLSGGFTEAELKASGCVEIWPDPEALWRNLGASLLSR
ncbi:HAD family hydrolase [Arenibaculum pallidiluteum]|uniref:HAD family hydrolase n=1 Tax=Arenibaculum pallidiluteum TaxID=2812559 RepID=UPI001A96D583|nr:HAD family hydrolase [Arenibaculum pallidiluteum]